MRPILVRLGPFPISSFGLFLLLAFFVSIAVARRRGSTVGIDPAQMLDMALYMIIGGIVVGRLGYVLANLSLFVQTPLRILTIWNDSGLSFFGALIGGLAVAAFYARAHHIALRRMLDVFAPALALGYAVAMIGALLHGLYPGKATGVPWSVYMLLDHRHPTQVYLLVASLGTYAVLRAQERQDVPPGMLFFLWLLLHALARVAVEVFVESPAILGPLTMAQVANVVAVIIALLGLVVSARLPVPEVGVAPAPVIPPQQSE